MPFRSEAERRYLWANKPTVARKIAHDTPVTGRKLPYHVKRNPIRKVTRR